MSNILAVSDSDFEQQVLTNDKPVLVDFWASWCAPCKAIAPILDDIAGEYADKLQIAKVNIEDSQETPQKYGVRGIPTLLLFKDGELLASHVGALSKSELSAFLDSNL